jgi:hypothetical protein
MDNDNKKLAEQISNQEVSKCGDQILKLFGQINPPPVVAMMATLTLSIYTHKALRKMGLNGATKKGFIDICEHLYGKIKGPGESDDQPLIVPAKN